MARHLVMTKMCLNNWHYINEKVLHFHKDINFFTGHSGSGKSTVLDALQIVLYADSNGRGFFNKAAKEDSDRTLLEYLRGMKVVKENNEAAYLRNSNFSTTIVLEFQNTETLDYQCIGIVFDVDVSSNDFNRLFFWHKGEMPENHYRTALKPFSISELKQYLKQNYEPLSFDFNNTNEKFRARLYHEYFGGLNEKTFPALFKRAIPFKMNMKLEEFVKEYIATERDIHMEDMQDSVMQYVRLLRRLEDTKQEIGLLEANRKQYEAYHSYVMQAIFKTYCVERLDLDTKVQKRDHIDKMKLQYGAEAKQLQREIEEIQIQIDTLQKERDAVMIALEHSGTKHIEEQIRANQELVAMLSQSKEKQERIAENLKVWFDVEELSDDDKNAFEHVTAFQASEDEFARLKSILLDKQKELLLKRNDYLSKKKVIQDSIDELQKEMNQLKSGKKAYPATFVEAKEFVQKELMKHFGVQISVRFVADTIEVLEPEWQNAIEGYMGGNKLSLVVDPEYVKEAMNIYEKLDSKKYSRVSILDTKRVMEQVKEPKPNSLAKIVKTDSEYMTAYMNYLLGNVICCEDVDSLRKTECGVTKDCLLYKGFKLKHMDPKNYRDFAYIGQGSVEARLLQIREELKEAVENMMPVNTDLSIINEALEREFLLEETSIYLSGQKAVSDWKEKEAVVTALRKKKEEILLKSQGDGKEQQKALEQKMKEKRLEKEEKATLLHDRQKALAGFTTELAHLEQEIHISTQALIREEKKDAEYDEMMKDMSMEQAEKLKFRLIRDKTELERKADGEFQKLLSVREQYQKKYAFRGFSVVSRENEDYDSLLENLRSDKLTDYMDKAREQGKTAIYHFKTDFIYKIRDAIKEVMEQKEELNRILADMNFGKDQYRFVIAKSRGPEGRFYDMFMDPNLEIKPQALEDNMENQVDLFSMQHENKYQELIHELLELFMPPEDSTPEMLEEARRNMEVYADYRTYLTFDMEQIIEGMPPMRLSKMLSKNSGGEGQNPLYVALLASFAQVYQINAKSTVKNRATPRLVVLDEAFSKMDAQKVESCISLMRNLGFQAIISATNDKIQNYVANVDKTFVFANPNKNHISIQEFEQKELTHLLESREG